MRALCRRDVDATHTFAGEEEVPFYSTFLCTVAGRDMPPPVLADVRKEFSLCRVSPVGSRMRSTAVLYTRKFAAHCALYAGA